MIFTKDHENETYKQWIAELRDVGRACNFVCKGERCECEFADELIRDIVILCTPDEHVRTAALRKDEPTLKEVLQIAETFESTQRKSTGHEDYNIFAVKLNMKKSNQQYQNNGKKMLLGIHKWPACTGCFTNHKKEYCKYLKAQCCICKKGHIAPILRSKQTSKHYIRALDESVYDGNNNNESMKEERVIFSCDVNENVFARADYQMFIHLNYMGILQMVIPRYHY